jgi:hypothetical protein
MGQAADQPTLIDVYINGDLKFSTSPVYLTATALYSDGTTKDVTYSGQWRSSNLSVANVYRGKVEFGSNTGNVTISFTLANKEASVGTEVIDLLGDISIIPNNIKYSEKSIQLKAQGRYTNGELREITQHVRWYSVNEDVARVNNDGLLTFTGRTGKTFIGVLFTSPLTRDTLKYELPNPIIVTEEDVEKDPPRPSMAYTIKIDGQLDPSKKTNTLKAYRLYIDDSKQNLRKDEVNWYSSNPNIATVDENGKVTFTGRAGKVIIYARDGRYSDKQASVEVLVPYKNESLSINESLNYTPLFLTSPPSLTVTGVDNNGQSQLVYGLEWSSSNPDIATINEQGQISFTGKPGTVTFTAQKDGLSATVQSIVPEDQARILSSIHIVDNLFYSTNPQQLQVLARHSDGFLLDITKECQWQSSDEQVATIYDGKVYFTGAPGSVTIRAQYEGFTDSVETIVRVPSSKQLAAIKFQKNFLSYADNNQPLTVMGIYTDNSSKPLNNVKFHSYRPNIARVINNKLVFSGNPGTALIEASSGNFRDVIEATVYGPQGARQPLYIQINGNLDLYLTTKVLEAKAIFANGQQLDITQEAVWNTSNKNIANLTDKGKVEVLGSGPYRISAAYNGQIAYISNNSYSQFGRLHPIKTNIVNLEELRKAAVDRLARNLYLPPLIDINTHWARKDIELARNLGWLGGYPDGTMRPDRPMARGEFASLLERALDLETTSRSFKYLDTDNHWARESIATIANLGLVPLDGTRNFRPNDPLTRGEMAQILNNLIEVRADRYYPYLDVPPNHPARVAIANVTQAKIMSGMDELHFKPEEPATRAQALAVILRLLKTDPAMLSVLNR